MGTFAEYLVAGPSVVLARKPAGLGFIQAAGMPLAGAAALDALAAIDAHDGVVVVVVGGDLPERYARQGDRDDLTAAATRCRARHPAIRSRAAIDRQVWWAYGRTVRAASVQSSREDDRLVLHQVHPVKLAADISASVISNVLLWRHHLGPALSVRYMLPAAGSAITLQLGDVDSLRDTPQGRYVLSHMPPEAMAVRLTGDAIMAWGSWRRSPKLILIGVAVVLAGWSHGLVEPDPDEADSGIFEE